MQNLVLCDVHKFLFGTGGLMQSCAGYIAIGVLHCLQHDIVWLVVYILTAIVRGAHASASTMLFRSHRKVKPNYIVPQMQCGNTCWNL